MSLKYDHKIYTTEVSSHFETYLSDFLCDDLLSCLFTKTGRPRDKWSLTYDHKIYTTEVSSPYGTYHSEFLCVITYCIVYS